MTILQQPVDRNLSESEKTIKDLLNNHVVVNVRLREQYLVIEFYNGQELSIDIDQVDWHRYELRVEVI